MREGEEWTRVCGYEKSKISKCYIRMLLQVLYARRDIQEESIMEKKKKKKTAFSFYWKSSLWRREQEYLDKRDEKGRKKRQDGEDSS